MVGSNLLMNYTCYPSNVVTDLIWEVSDPSVAKIDEYGLLTALQPGTVTVTVSNADRTVSETHTIRVVGNGAITSAVVSSTLSLSGTALSGNLSLTVTNTGSAVRSSQVLAVFYSADGRMLSSQFKTVTLASGANTVTFSGISIPVTQTQSVTARFFVLDTAGSYKPLADVCSKTITK